MHHPYRRKIGLRWRSEPGNVWVIPTQRGETTHGSGHALRRDAVFLTRTEFGTSDALHRLDERPHQSSPDRPDLPMIPTEEPWSDEDPPTFPQVLHAKRVLVAEDDAAMRDLLLLVLRERGYAVDCVSSGSQMMRVLSERRPDGSLAEPFDLIVTDVRMPGASGLDAIDQLRRAGGITPVIAVTAFPHDATRDRAQRLEIRLLAKPLDLDTLRHAVKAALDSTFAEPSAERKP